MTPSSSNRAVIACAGSGKTRSIVGDALSATGARVLLTTYTLENVEQIRRTFLELRGHVPAGMRIASWYEFLFRDGVRPYQNHILPQRGTTPIQSIDFLLQKRPFQRREQYLTKAGQLYRDKVAEFAHEAHRSTQGAVVRRLERMYDLFFVDELQDLAGYDLEFLTDVLRSSIRVTLVGDPRQATFATNRSAKNRGYRRTKIYGWVLEREKSGDLALEELCKCYRSNQAICDFADSLYPDLPASTSQNLATTGHDGVFLIRARDVSEYVRRFQPTVLRYDKRSRTYDLSAVNIGQTKGCTLGRVLVMPTKPMKAFLAGGNPSGAGDLARLYVAVTRAKFSVAFVVGDDEKLEADGSGGPRGNCWCAEPEC